MCGIFGMVGDNCVKGTIDSLRALEYRGYDSVGVSVKDEDGLHVEKVVGRSQNLAYVREKYIHATSCIGHTRWATHGAVTRENAHPFLSYGGDFAIVHNGVIDNWSALKTMLTDGGVQFTSQTDSETIAHLLQKNYDGDVLSCVCKTAKMLKGAYAVAVQTTFDDNLYVVKKRSPLVVGSSDGGNCVCSDVRCIARYAETVSLLPDDAVAVVGKNVTFYDYDGNMLEADFFCPDKNDVVVPEEEVMLSEIYEIPDKIRAAKRGYIGQGGIGIPARRLRGFNRIYLLGCGTAYHSGLETAAVVRKFMDVDVIPVVASEFVYDNYPVDERTLAFCISQSGETADTIRSAERVTANGGYAYAVTNTDASGLVFVCNRSVNVCAGGEFAVASTKAYNCQLATLLLLFADIAVARRCVVPEFKNEVCRALDKAANAAAIALEQSSRIEMLAEEIKDCSSVFFIGRTVDYPTAEEGALKLKEISYMHCEAYPAGELKHGALAMVERGVAVIAVATDISLAERTEASLAEARSRGARVLCVSPYDMTAECVSLPVVGCLVSGIVSVIPLQLLAYYVAVKLGRDVDKPRNLAKSVTVE